MARKTSRKGASSDPEAAGEQYATDQIASTYFADWVRDQMLEASKLPPEGVLPLETKADATVIARNMLRQLEQDTRRDLRGDEISSLLGTDEVSREAHREFFEGFRKTCDASRDWLADELLTIKGEMGGGGVGEASRALTPADRHQLAILKDTLRNPLKGKFLGGPSAEEAEEILRDKFYFTDAQIQKLKGEGVGEARTMRARRPGGTRGGPAKKYYVVDQVQGGLWVQVGHFYWKGEAERFQATLGGKTRIKHTFPSGHDHPPQ
jgi:hypothetical protein